MLRLIDVLPFSRRKTNQHTKRFQWYSNSAIFMKSHKWFNETFNHSLLSMWRCVCFVVLIFFARHQECAFSLQLTIKIFALNWSIQMKSKRIWWNVKTAISHFEIGWIWFVSQLLTPLSITCINNLIQHHDIKTNKS